MFFFKLISKNLFIIKILKNQNIKHNVRFFGQKMIFFNYAIFYLFFDTNNYAIYSTTKE